MILEVLLIVAAVAFLFYKQTRVPAGMPPGSFGWPIIGELPENGKPIYQHFHDLAKKRGKIFTTKWGSIAIVVLADISLIKKAFNHPDLQGRKELNSFIVMNNNDLQTGVLFSSGAKWAANRRFMLRHLRDLGMGKTKLENSIQDEAGMLVKYLAKQNLEEPVTMDFSINVSVLNVIWELLAGIRYDADDEKILQFAKLLDNDVALIQGPMFLLDIMPWLSWCSPSFIANRVFQENKFKESRAIFREMFDKIIDDHLENLDPDNPRDIVDQYLLELQNQDSKEGVQFERGDILSVMNDMFTAGSETTSNTLRWMVLYMAANPEVQKKAHDELDKVVAKDKLPSLEDRQQLAYIDAMILDVLRLSSLVPIGVQHSATADVEIEGYTIPKGTMLFPNLETFHHDPALWEKPLELYPEHFLDSEGKLDGKKEGFMPFAIGRRQCLGESLARMELFLFGAAILHHFEISAPPGVKLNLEADPGKYILRQPLSFEVMLKKRT